MGPGVELWPIADEDIVNVDFLSAEPEDFTTLDGLTELVLSEIRRQRA